MSPRSRIVALVALLVVVLLAAVACGAPARQARTVGEVAPQAPAATAAPAAMPAAQPTAAPFPTMAPAPPQEAPAGSTSSDAQIVVSPIPVPGGSPSNRKIIKDGELNLVVDEIVRAIDRVTKIATDVGGYVVSSELSTQGDARTATVRIGVPSEAFEDVMRQLRGSALKVNWERSTGSDVTSEYVDLQSQLTNLQATQARLRDFLKQATTVEEALKVNAELSKIEGEIETIQGRLNYLSNRSAYSTITLYLEQIQPTPTITPTPSITPTPTATPTATPIVWHPDETFHDAGITLQYVLRGIGDFGIWGAVVCLPVIIVILIIVAPIVWLRRRRRAARTVAAPAAPPAKPPEDKPGA